jgi:hypothetical protein
VDEKIVEVVDENGVEAVIDDVLVTDAEGDVEELVAVAEVSGDQVVEDEA